jgi:hypothetical protein
VRQWDWPVVWPDPQLPGPGSSMTMLPKEKRGTGILDFYFS